jgi:hypothetical protein
LQGCLHNLDNADVRNSISHDDATQKEGGLCCFVLYHATVPWYASLSVSLSRCLLFLSFRCALNLFKAAGQPGKHFAEHVNEGSRILGVVGCFHEENKFDYCETAYKGAALEKPNSDFG